MSILCAATLFACSGADPDGTHVGSSTGATTSGGGGASGGGAGTYACPQPGDKVCPNDAPTTASDANTCHLCFAEWQAASACGEQLHGTCGPDGKKTVPTLGPCGDQVVAYIECALRTIGKDKDGGVTVTD